MKMPSSLESRRKTETQKSVRLLMSPARCEHSILGAANGTKGKMQRFQALEQTQSCSGFVKTWSMMRALLKMRSPTGDRSCGGATKCRSLKERRRQIESAMFGFLRVSSRIRYCFRQLCPQLALNRLSSALDSIRALSSSIQSRRPSDLHGYLHSDYIEKALRNNK